MEDENINLLSLANPSVKEITLLRYNPLRFYTFDVVLSVEIEGVPFDLHGYLFLSDTFTMLGYGHEIREVLRFVRPVEKVELVLKSQEAGRAVVEKNSSSFAF